MSTLQLFRDGKISGLEFGQSKAAVLAILGPSNPSKVVGLSDDMHWGDLSVIFDNGTVLYTQVVTQQAQALDLPTSLEEAEAIRRIPRDLSAAVEYLRSNSIECALDKSQPAMPTITTHSNEGKIQLIFNRDSLLKILFSWPATKDQHPDDRGTESNK